MSLVYAPRYGLLSSLPNTDIPLFLAIQLFASSCTTVILIPLNSASRILSINHGATHLAIASKHLGANCVTTIDPPSAATDSVVRAPYARTPKIVTVKLLHNRLGHVSTKAILAANEAGVWEDVTVRFAPSSFCIDCKVGTSRVSNRGKSPVGHANR